MRNLVLFVAVVACAHAALITPREKNPFKLVMGQQGNPSGLSSKDLHEICDKCLNFFQKVKESIGDYGKLTKEKLTKALDDVCKKLPEDFPGKHELCDLWTPKLVEYIYNYYKDLEESIDPKKSCQLVFLCPRHPKTTTASPEVPTGPNA
ncbi:unnamed protein product [Bursaphelenchus xylophilus]|uniref:(pine wood nematode) hypothetical protein n=1 Tax=Bursaphelenchus xylophilus TaxID=6326 RepID=A0A1I7RW34_BURXY|nr:unnamed protein product [Bursaphelenchus xylophilus]CAG9095073.1 unnamed protein product [Bursaphelenchus xylophilus]